VTAETLNSDGFGYLEIDPHALVGAALGRSQRAVTELLGSTVAERAAVGPLIVLLDEVETLAPARSKLSLEANPVDVHRAADAVLVQLDRLASQHRGLLFVATSNFPEAVDQAFWSRADLVVRLETPGPEACRKILVDAIEALTVAYPQLAYLTRDAGLLRAAGACAGLDGRSIRKLVVSACALDKHTALHPDRLTMADLVRAAQHARRMAGLPEGGAQ
jgi:AAA+ superfamily predicted ATPase